MNLVVSSPVELLTADSVVVRLLSVICCYIDHEFYFLLDHHGKLLFLSRWCEGFSQEGVVR